MISLSDAELISDVITASDWKGKCTIGLRSSLRKTNQSSDFSCLLISTKIKPFFISWQIIHSIAVREKIPKVFCFPNLEELTLKLFRKKSSALLLPTSAAKTIRSWLEAQQQLHPIPRNLLPKENTPFEKLRKEKEFIPSIDLQDFYVSSSEDRFFVPKVVRRKNSLSLVKEDQCWSGDFISFGDAEMKDAVQIDSEEDKDNLENMLSKFSKTVTVPKVEQKAKKKKGQSIRKEPMTNKVAKTPSEDEFLEDYLGVTVQKIQKNPDKVKKKKKKKSKSLKS